MRYLIPFNKPFLIGKELEYIRQAVESGVISGDGVFSDRCGQLLQRRFGVGEVLLVSSGTSALDLAAAVCGFQPGDEVIMPSFTFVSTASAFVRLGVRPVFVEIRPDTMNLDEARIEDAITSRTRAIVPVHYASIGCEMDAIMEIARRRDLIVIEDAAQAVNAYYKTRALGSIGHLATYSFHEAKNVGAGQAGAVLVNDARFLAKAEILRDKGTNRRQFFRGQVSKYVWLDVGVAHSLSEINAAFLFAQLEELDAITEKRERIDRLYRDLLGPLEAEGLFETGKVSDHCQTNYHIFYMLMRDSRARDELSAYLRANGVSAPFHYAPLHSAPMGERIGYKEGDLPITEDAAARLIRLPVYHTLEPTEQELIGAHIHAFFARRSRWK